MHENNVMILRYHHNINDLIILFSFQMTLSRNYDPCKDIVVVKFNNNNHVSL